MALTYFKRSFISCLVFRDLLTDFPKKSEKDGSFSQTHPSNGQESFS